MIQYRARTGRSPVLLSDKIVGILILLSEHKGYFFAPSLSFPIRYPPPPPPPHSRPPARSRLDPSRARRPLHCRPRHPEEIRTHRPALASPPGSPRRRARLFG